MRKQKTISMAELAKHTERIATDIESSGAVYRIKRPGHRHMLLVDSLYIDSLQATIEFMALHPNWEQEFAQAEKDVREGRYVTLEHVMKEYGRDADGRALPRGESSARRPAARRARKGSSRTTRPRARAS